MPYKDKFFFNYYLPTRIVFGAGELKNVTREMDALKIRKSLVVTDSFGNYDSIEGRAVLNGGITDSVAGRVSVSHRQHSGYSENITTGADLDGEDNWSARGQLLFTPTDASRLLLGYDFVKDDNAGNARVPYPVFDTGQVGPANNVALAAGSHTIAIAKDWGWIAADYIEIVPASSP